MLKKTENQTFELCQEAVLQNGFELKYIKDKQTSTSLYDTALKQVTIKYAKLYNIIDQIKEPHNQNEQWLKESTDEILLNQYFELKHIIRNAFCGDLNQFKEIFEAYDITHYKGKNDYYQLCLSYDEIIDKHADLEIALQHNNIKNIFDLYIGEYKKFLENKININTGEIKIYDAIYQLFYNVKYPPNFVKVIFDEQAWNNAWNGDETNKEIDWGDATQEWDTKPQY